MWLSLDNTEVKKANMSGMFRVNLASIAISTLPSVLTTT